MEVFGVSPLRAHDPSKVGEDCVFEKVVNQGVFSISINYADAPDPHAVVKWLKSLETNTYYTARPGGSGSGGSGADDYNDLQNRIHNVEVQRNIWSGACKPPVGCY